MSRRIDDETLSVAILLDVPARRLFPWPAQAQNGRFVDAYDLLAALRTRTGDPSITLEDVDRAMRRLRAHRLNYPLSRLARAVIRRALRSSRPGDRRPDYFIDDWTWRRTLRRRRPPRRR